MYLAVVQEQDAHVGFATARDDHELGYLPGRHVKYRPAVDTFVPAVANAHTFRSDAAVLA